MDDNHDRPIIDYGHPGPEERSVKQFIIGVITSALLTQIAVCAGGFATGGGDLGGAFGILIILLGVAGILYMAYRQRQRRQLSYSAGLFSGVALVALLWGACFAALSH